MIVDTVRQFLQSHAIRGPLVVAVSGGPDSTALLLALVDIGIAVIVGHVNHHLRGIESDADEDFVRKMCAKIGVQVRMADGALDPDLVRRHGVEAAAREVRNALLQMIRSDEQASHIATAHQKNDQAETVLMRMMTGGGLAGLRGIHPLRADGVIRPLLDVSRADIEAFLRERGVSARVDRSNADPRFLRNRIRALLAQFDPSVVDNLAAIARQAREQWDIHERILDIADSSVQTPSETRFRSFPPEPWLRQALLHRHIRRLDPHSRDVSAADLERIASQLDSLKRVSITRDLELLRRGEEWILRRRPQATEEFEVELKPDKDIYLAQIGKTIRVRRGQRPTASGQRFQIPEANPTFTIRNRRDGDRFQPLGMAREKKLKDFLIDRKIPSESRDRIPLLIWSGKIVCVTGVEISEAFKVTGGGELYEVAIEETNQEGIQREADRQADR
ncbi:MAG TPA: tRNA lysidine(34) synthetase TilS [Thermoanaerobaculia bacterium]